MLLKSGTFTNKKFKMLLYAQLLGWVISLLGGMADSIIAGIYLDENAVAAVGLVSPLASLILFFAMLIAYGVAAMYSTELGAFHIERSQKIAGMGLVTSVVVGALLAILMVAGKNAFLAFYDCSTRIMELASQYYDYFIWIALVQPFIWFIYYLVTFDGDEKIILAVDITMAVMNTVLSLLFVQSMGVAGLALGTFLSYVLGLVVLIPHFFRKSNSIRFKRYFSLKDLWTAVKTASAFSSITLYLALTDIVMNKVIIVLFGDSYLTAYTVVNTVLNIACAFSCGASAAGPLVSVGYGEKNYNAIRRVMKRATYATLIVSVVFTVLLFAIAPLWPGIYGISDPAVISAATFAGRIIPVSFVAEGLIYLWLGYYPLVGRTIEGNILSLFQQLAGPLTLSILLGSAFGFRGLACGFFLTPIVAIAILYGYFAARKLLKKAPLLLPDMEETEANFDLRLDRDSILCLRDKAGDFLKEQGVAPMTINEIQVIIEETLLHIQERNKRKVLCECVLLVNDEHVRMITKDNGVIFDITKEADDSLDLRCYVMARMMESASETSNTTTSSFNRNTYIWER